MEEREELWEDDIIDHPSHTPYLQTPVMAPPPTMLLIEGESYQLLDPDGPQPDFAAGKLATHISPGP